MKVGEVGLDDVVIEVCKSWGDKGVLWLTKLFNKIMEYEHYESVQ